MRRTCYFFIIAALYSLGCSDSSDSSSGEEGSDETSGTSGGNQAASNGNTTGGSNDTSGGDTSATSGGNTTTSGNTSGGNSNGNTTATSGGPNTTDGSGSGGSSNDDTSGSGSGGESGSTATQGSVSTGGASPDAGPPPNESTETLPPGATLPSDEECAQQIRRSSWEPRPDNDAANHNVPTNLDLASWGDGRIDQMIERVTGNFTGTTDEILQWGACKWGFDVQTVRAQAVIESYWHMDTKGDINYNGECHPAFPDMGDGCPQSFGILQVRFTSVETFNSAMPMVAEMTALNVELTLLTRRACFEGYQEWLNQVEGRGDYAAGDVWGCMGAWFAGRWYTDPAQQYIAAVRDEFENKHSWLNSDF